MFLKVFRMMIIIMMFDRLPSDIDQIAVSKPFDGFLDTAARDAFASFNMPYNVCPKWPRTLVPSYAGTFVYGSSDGVAQQRLTKRVA